MNGLTLHITHQYKYCDEGERVTQLRDGVEGVKRLVSGKEKGENAPASQEHIQPIWHGMPLVMSFYNNGIMVK